MLIVRGVEYDRLVVLLAAAFELYETGARDGTFVAVVGMLWPLLRGVGVRAQLQKLLVAGLFDSVRASLYLLRINSVDTLVNQVLVMFIVVVMILTILNGHVRYVQRFHCVLPKCTRRRPNIFVFGVHDVVVHWVRLLFVRVRLDYLIDHFFLLVVQHTTCQIAHVLARLLIHGAE